MKPIIGIVTRKSKSYTGKCIDLVYTDIISSVIKSGGIPIGINNDIDMYINICDGYIFQGGDDINDKNIEMIKILREKNIPVLGICLGMQEMGRGILKDIDNHLNKMHIVIVSKDSLLHRIVGEDRILVNSRHKSAIKDTDLCVSGRSDDGIIEAIEDNTRRFFLGVQWHPENMYDLDSNSRKIFDYFIKMCHH